MDIQIKLQEIYAAIEAGIRAQLPGVCQVMAWPDLTECGAVPLPAVFIEMSGLKPGQDQGTGQTPLQALFEARIVVAPENMGHQQRAAFMASQLAVLLREQCWGLDVEPAEFLEAAPDWMKPELDGFTVWVVQWRQQIYLGDEKWPWEDSSGLTAMFGVDPDVGAGNEGSYGAPADLEQS